MNLDLVNALAGVLSVVVGVLAWLYPRQDRHPSTSPPDRSISSDVAVAERSAAKGTSLGQFERPLRMLVVLAVTFGAVSVSARVGYEVGAESGILWGAIVGLALSLVAMWAFSRWWKEVAVVASVLAAVGVVYLIVAGLVMLFVNFVVGMPMTVSEGMCCLGGGIAVFAAGAALFALYLVAPDLFAEWFIGPSTVRPIDRTIKQSDVDIGTSAHRRLVVRERSPKDSLFGTIKPIDRTAKQRETGAGSSTRIRPVIRRKPSRNPSLGAVKPIDRAGRGDNDDRG